MEKPEVLYGELQGVFGYWYPEMDMDMWLKPIQEKAYRWDQYAIYDNDIKEKILVKDLITAYLKLEAVKKLVEKGPLINVDTLEDCQQAVDDWLGKLMNFIDED